MKSVIALTIGLMVAGAAAAHSGFSIGEVYSYMFSTAGPGTFDSMLLAGLALILFVSFREHQALIDRKGL